MALDFGTSLFSKEGEKREAVIRDYFTVGDTGSDSQAILEIDTSTAAEIIAKSNSITNFQFKTYGNTTYGNLIGFMKARGKINTPADIVTNDFMGQIDVSAYYNGIFNGVNAIRFRYRGNRGDPTWIPYTSIHFTTTALERMEIDENGQVELIGTKGTLLLNRLTTVQRDALTPINGMILYNSTLNKFQGYENGAWTSLI